MATKLTAQEQLVKDQKMKARAEVIRNKLIDAQTYMAELNNDIDSFGREFESDEANAQIMVWTASVAATGTKMKSGARKNLLSDSKSKVIKLDKQIIEVVWATPTSPSLDTTKMKKLDTATYDYLAKKFPKSMRPKATIKVKDR